MIIRDCSARLTCMRNRGRHDLAISMSSCAVPQAQFLYGSQGVPAGVGVSLLRHYHTAEGPNEGGAGRQVATPISEGGERVEEPTEVFPGQCAHRRGEKPYDHSLEVGGGEGAYPNTNVSGYEQYLMLSSQCTAQDVCMDVRGENGASPFSRK